MKLIDTLAFCTGNVLKAWIGSIPQILVML